MHGALVVRKASEATTHPIVASYVHAAQEGLGAIIADRDRPALTRAAVTHVAHEVDDGQDPSAALASVTSSIVHDCVVAQNATWENRFDSIMPVIHSILEAMADPTLEESLPLNHVLIVREVSLLLNEPHVAYDTLKSVIEWQSATPVQAAVFAYARAAVRAIPA